MKKMKKIFVMMIIANVILVSCMNNKSKTIEISPLTKMNDLKEYNSLTINRNIEPLRISHENIVQINIPEEFTNCILDIDSLVANYKFIRLDTNDSCLIGKIDKIISDSSCLFVYDKRNSSVFKFDDNGKFLCKIDYKGKGPTEYNEAWDMTLNRVCL